MYIIPLKSGGEKKCYASTLVVNGGTNYDKGEKSIYEKLLRPNNLGNPQLKTM